ncbi:uncharacterized protein EDB91DRAFT_1131793 [Suillus paluster]|uniref:uncharacterized protein n=1 Tax=Suillus paluster TaxID=48578 RepID=UPI001B885BCF|nr:uncharacterized protein EDB91DRAFT_1131793 [Suillus paluster]KAG1740851.1 hypothetical protein EDB91DRAFT_1131793 [Suillus paluster]
MQEIVYSKPVTRYCTSCSSSVPHTAACCMPSAHGCFHIFLGTACVQALMLAAPFVSLLRAPFPLALVFVPYRKLVPCSPFHWYMFDICTSCMPPRAHNSPTRREDEIQVKIAVTCLSSTDCKTMNFPSFIGALYDMHSYFQLYYVIACIRVRSLCFAHYQRLEFTST